MADGQAPMFRHERVHLETAVEHGLPCLMADPEALSAAVRNLLDNAANYSPSCDTVWLAAEARGGEVRIRVSDKGLGIPVEEQSKIFGRFYRPPGGISRRIKGVGLGLALTRQIVLARGGEVRVESSPGKGSAFTIHLKAAA